MNMAIPHWVCHKPYLACFVRKRVYRRECSVSPEPTCGLCQTEPEWSQKGNGIRLMHDSCVTMHDNHGAHTSVLIFI